MKSHIQPTRVLLLFALSLGIIGLACNLGGPVEKAKEVGTIVALAPTLQAGAGTLAATGGTLVAEIGPTLEAAATDLAPTLEAAASGMAPTMEAAMTQLAPTLNAAATALPLPSDGTPVGGINEFFSMTSGSQGLSGLASFRQTAVMTLNSNGQSGTVDYWGEFTTNPQATHGRVTLAGLAAAGLPLPTFEYIVIEGSTWIKVGPLAWIPVEDVETFTGQQPFSADDLLFSVPNAQRVMPDETINGIPCKHYVYNTSDLQLPNGYLNSAYGDIYTAVDGGYIVRYTLQGEGTWEQYFGGMTGVINLNYQVFDVNSGIAIQPPQ